MDSKSRLSLLHGDETAKRVAKLDRVEQLMAEGRSRLTAHRIVEIENGQAEASRARRHAQSR